MTTIKQAIRRSPTGEPAVGGPVRFDRDDDDAVVRMAYPGEFDMTVIATTCTGCGAEFQPDRQAILRGEWRTCPKCRAKPATETERPTSTCTGCGRTLRGGRTLCLSCLGGSAA